MGWEVVEGGGTVEVNETGIYIDGEYLADMEGNTNE